MIEVSRSILEDYLNLKIAEADLFPADAPAGTGLDDLMPEHEDSAVCTLEQMAHVFEQFLDEEITFEQMESWISCILETDLFVLDDSKGEEALDWMFNTLCYLSGFEDEEEILDQVDFTALIDKAEAY